MSLGRNGGKDYDTNFFSFFDLFKNEGCGYLLKILNLFAGIGGNRTLWDDDHEITAIEYDLDIAAIYINRFPNDNILMIDAYEYLEKHYKEFDFIWASPPCPTHSKLEFQSNHKKRLPDMRLYSLIIFLQYWYKGDWAIENVIGYYKPLIKQTAIIDRHFFWSNLPLMSNKFPKRRGNLKYVKTQEWCDFLGIDIMNIKIKDKRKLLRNCVRPEVGKYILDSINNKNLGEWL